MEEPEIEDPVSDDPHLTLPPHVYRIPLPRNSKIAYCVTKRRKRGVGHLWLFLRISPPENKTVKLLNDRDDCPIYEYTSGDVPMVIQNESYVGDFGELGQIRATEVRPGREWVLEIGSVWAFAVTIDPV